MLATRTPLVVPTQPAFLALLLLIGLSGFVAQFLLVLGLQRETAGRGSTGMYAQLVFALALERAVFGTRPGWMSLCGMAIIVGCGVYVAVSPRWGCGGLD
jgi:drug/metabolite transporter (DMT)-like permease